MASISPAVAIVGAGPVAQALGRGLMVSGAPVVAVASRSRAHAEQAALFINAPATAERTAGIVVRVVDLAALPQLASHVLIAVADRGIEAVAAGLARAGMQSGVALHTCGAKGPSALQPLRAAGVACGMLHPLQTIATPEQGARSLANTTFGLAGDPDAIAWGEQIVAAFQGQSLRVDASRLSHYHAGAVMASNAVIAALDAAVVLFGAAGIAPDQALRAIAPLARTSVDNAVAGGTLAALTGPVVRGDAATVADHLRAVRMGDPAVARLYEAAAGHLLQLAKRRGLPAERIHAIQAALDGDSRV